MLTLSSPLYTWESCKGNLSLFNQNGNYHFSFESNDNQTTQILAKNVKGIPLNSMTDKVSEFCEAYFFKTEKKDNEILVTFFPSTNLDNFMITDDAQSSSDFKSFSNISFEFNKLEQKKNLQFSKTAPSYRQAGQGLNMEGKCTNQECVAGKVGAFVIIHKGLGQFNIAKEQFKSSCPACDKNIEPNNLLNLGFWDCHYQISGHQTKPEKKLVEGAAEKAPKTHYTTFATGDNGSWSYLEVETYVDAKKTEAKQSEESGSCIIL